MPQVLTAALVAAGVSKVVATVISTTVFIAGSVLVSKALAGGGARSEAAERTIKAATPARSKGYGTRRLFGKQMLFDTAANGTTVDVLAFHGGRVSAIVGHYLNDELAVVSGTTVQPFDDDSYGGGNVSIGTTLGETPGTAFGAVVSLMPGIWTNDHRGDGIAAAYITKRPVKAKEFLEVYPQGDNVELSIAYQLQPVFDPREGGQSASDPSTWTYSENACLHLLHYFLTERGYDYATRIEPVLDYWTAAADDCDTAITLAAGGTEPKYRGCVVYDATARPADVISELLACFDGWTDVDAEGCVRVYSGAVYEPTVSIGPGDIAAYSLQSHVEEENRVNELVVHYVSAEHKYETVEGQSWLDEADISARGRKLSDGVAPQVPSHTQARRIAKRAMLRRNSPNRGTVMTLISGNAVIGERYINLTIEDAGEIYSGLVEIVGLEHNYDTGGVSFEWVAVADEMDEWEPEEEDGDGAAVGSFVPKAPLTAPTIISAVFFGTDEVGEGVPGARIRISIDGPERDDLTWWVSWRSLPDGQWITAPYEDADPGPPILVETDFVPIGDVAVTVAYQVGDGRISPESDPATEIHTDSITADRDDITADSTNITADRT